MDVLLVIAAICFGLMCMFHAVIRWRVCLLFKEIREQAPHVWERIGSPPTFSDAIKDPEKRWKLLIRDQKFLGPEDSTLAHRILTVRRRIIVACYLAIFSALVIVVFAALRF